MIYVDLLIRRMEQYGIDIRHPEQMVEMQKYIQHLNDELRMTEEFLSECHVKPECLPT